MRAVVYRRYGSPDVLKIEEVGKPIPLTNELLIKIQATTVTPQDVKFRSGGTIAARLAAGLFRPNKKVLGIELAGEVEEIGNDVKEFKVGDQVYGGGRYGTYAEYICMPEDKVAHKPTNMTYEEAGAVHFGAGTALCLLRDYGSIRRGQKVLINGASSDMGTFAVQLAKYYETEVTGVCDTANQELVKSLGADYVIDDNKDDFTKGDQTYDIIFDALGNSSYSRCHNLLSQHGVYLSTVATALLLFQMLWTSVVSGKKAIFAMPMVTRDDLNFLKILIEDGQVRTVIDRRYPLNKTVEAHKYAEKGYAKGKVIVTI